MLDNSPKGTKFSYLNNKSIEKLIDNSDIKVSTDMSSYLEVRGIMLIHPYHLSVFSHLSAYDVKLIQSVNNLMNSLSAWERFKMRRKLQKIYKGLKNAIRTNPVPEALLVVRKDLEER